MATGFPAFSTRPPRTELPTQVDRAARILVVDDSITILKVVGAILEQHGYEPTVAVDGLEGLSKLENEGPFDLVLLDFVMPKMNGYQFCRELRERGLHQSVPVVLMSARTPVIGDRFVEQTGAVDALSKPFDARALVAVVGAVLAKRDQGEIVKRQLPAADAMLDEAELGAPPESQSPPSRHFRALNRFTSQVALAIVPSLRQLRPSDLGQPQLVEDAVAAGLGRDEVVAELMRTLDALDTQQSGTEILRGEAEHIPLAELLQLLQLRRQTGVLRACHGRKTVTMAIRNGTVDLAQGQHCGEEFLLGRYLVEAGWIGREQVEQQVEACNQTGLIGTWLVEAGLLGPEQLEQALARQSAELVYEALRWPKGRYRLFAEPFPHAAELARLGLGLSELVLEGFRRVDEWRHMADTIDFEAVLSIDQVARAGLDDAKVRGHERPVLEAVDGQRTVAQIIEATSMASFDVIKILFGFLKAGIVRQARERKAKE